MKRRIKKTIGALLITSPFTGLLIWGVLSSPETLDMMIGSITIAFALCGVILIGVVLLVCDKDET